MRTPIVLVLGLAFAAVVGFTLMPSSETRLTPKANSTDAANMPSDQVALNDPFKFPRTIVDVAEVGAMRPAICEWEFRYEATTMGTSRKVMICHPSKKGAHPYKEYSSETLATLAYGDAKAAEVLGMRLRDTEPDTALNLILRAVALSNDPSAIVAFSNSYHVPTGLNGEPVIEGIRMRYLLNVVAETLGSDRSTRAFWASRIRSVEGEADRQIAALDAEAEKLLDEISRIQLQVLGQNLTGGHEDA